MFETIHFSSFTNIADKSSLTREAPLALQSPGGKNLYTLGLHKFYQFQTSRLILESKFLSQPI